ncbi:uncharacterized protein [Elaeis guineensis]|uniref:Uncharacterized protein LOC105032149 n=1 Tax=Elaeis guineensis var. tenera TaxID=51953 RepID=A0A8N4EXI0_ELAGV|nr:uncharacterized protein LOC105032149 [Elaeis guineensis]
MALCRMRVWLWPLLLGIDKAISLKRLVANCCCVLSHLLNWLVAGWVFMKLLFSLHADKLWIEGDSSAVINWITSFNAQKNSLWPILRDVLTWKATSHPWIISHIFREANQAADWLASGSISGALQFSQLDPLPAQLCAILHADAIGVIHERQLIFQILTSWFCCFFNSHNYCCSTDSLIHIIIAAQLISRLLSLWEEANVYFVHCSPIADLALSYEIYSLFHNWLMVLRYYYPLVSSVCIHGRFISFSWLKFHSSFWFKLWHICFPIGHSLFIVVARCFFQVFLQQTNFYWYFLSDVAGDDIAERPCVELKEKVCLCRVPLFSVPGWPLGMKRVSGAGCIL